MSKLHSSYTLFVILTVAIIIGSTTAYYCDGLIGGTLIKWHDPQVCERFYACQHGTDHEWFCPPGEFFSQRNQQCESTCNPLDQSMLTVFCKSGWIILTTLFDCYFFHRSVVCRACWWNIYSCSSEWAIRLQQVLYLCRRNHARTEMPSRIFIFAVETDVWIWVNALLMYRIA